MLAIGRSLFGVFSGANTPNLANFPSGVHYQRNANFTTGTLLNTDGVSPVAVSIDPFFFRWIPLKAPPIVTRGPRAPINPRQPIIRPIIPPSPISPRDPGPPRLPITPRDPGPISPSQEPPTDLEL
jgi:hypothetical protein